MIGFHNQTQKVSTLNPGTKEEKPRSQNTIHANNENKLTLFLAFLPAGTSGCETGMLTMYSKRNTIVNKGWFIISFSSNRPLSFKVTPPGTKNSEKIQI